VEHDRDAARRRLPGRFASCQTAAYYGYAASPPVTSQFLNSPIPK
jgi:hypothetical protein